MSGNNSASSQFPSPRLQPAGTDAESGRGSRPPVAPRGEKSKRLLKRADFQRVYQQGRRQFMGNMTVFFLRRAEANGTPRVGLTVGKVLGGAVERNRIKRRMREAVRLSWQAVEGPVDLVFNPRKSVLTLPFADLQNEIERGLRLATQRARTAPAETK